MNQKTTILLVRHGQSESNLSGTFTGQDDTPLTELGRQQARASARLLENRSIDIAYASDLSRAMETAQLICASHGIPLIAEPALREIDGGSWEGLKFERIAEEYPEDYCLWHEKIGLSRPTGGESVREVWQRSNACLDKLCKINPGKTILVVAHGCVLRTIAARALGRTPEELTEVPWVPNCSVSTLVEENGTLQLTELGKSDHIGSLSTNLPSSI